jgi:hypothetical protein
VFVLAVLARSTGLQQGTDATKFSELFPGIDLRQLAASFCFFIPIYRSVLFGSSCSWRSLIA